MSIDEWMKPTIVGIFLIVLAVMYAVAKNEFNIWIILIVILGAVDIALGILRKRKGEL